MRSTFNYSSNNHSLLSTNQYLTFKLSFNKQTYVSEVVREGLWVIRDRPYIRKVMGWGGVGGGGGGEEREKICARQINLDRENAKWKILIDVRKNSSKPNGVEKQLCKQKTAITFHLLF